MSNNNFTANLTKTSNTLWVIAGVGMGVGAAYCGIKAAIATAQLIIDDIKDIKAAAKTAKVEAEATQAPVADPDDVEED